MDWIETSTGTVTVPIFGKAAGYLVDDSSYYTGIGDDFTIDQYDIDGRHVRRIRRVYAPREITKSMLDRYAAEFLAMMPASRRDQDRRGLADRSRTGLLPAYSQNFLVDRDGNLWVPHYLVWYWNTPESDEAAWSVFNSDGRWLGVVQMPARLHPREIGSDYVLGIWRDESDVETVRRYALMKPG